MSDSLPKHSEKRNFQRMDLELPVRIEVEGKQIETNTQNISCGGMFLPIGNPEAAEKLKEEGGLLAYITIPEQYKTVQLAGRIKRIQRNSDRDPVGVAIQFSGLFDDNFLEIDRYLKTKTV